MLAKTSEFGRGVRPWMHDADNFHWNDRSECCATIWLAETCRKTIHELTGKDFLDHGLKELLKSPGGTDGIRERVFNRLIGAVDRDFGGGTVLFQSPHPDDDVISAGGGLVNTCLKSDDVYVAYMTCGDTAVYDHAALRELDLIRRVMDEFDWKDRSVRNLISRAERRIADGEGEKHEDVLRIKALIRESEALSAAMHSGVHEKNVRFLNLKFYHRKDRRVELAQDHNDSDLTPVVELLRECRPDTILMAGDLCDPHGTHETAGALLLSGIESVSSEDESYAPEVWLYRGAWQEFEPWQIDKIVPVTPEVFACKTEAILRHETQAYSAKFPGDDSREFWERAENRTRATAQRLAALGLPRYHAVEAYARLSDDLRTRLLGTLNRGHAEALSLTSFRPTHPK